MREKALKPFPLEPLTALNGPDVSRNWHTWLNALIAALPKIQTFSFTLNAGAVSANSTRKETVAIAGLTTADIVHVNKPAYLSGIVLDCTVEGPGVLAITFANVTTGSIDPGSVVYRGHAIRL